MLFCFTGRVERDLRAFCPFVPSIVAEAARIAGSGLYGVGKCKR